MSAFVAWSVLFVVIWVVCYALVSWCEHLINLARKVNGKPNLGERKR